LLEWPDIRALVSQIGDVNEAKWSKLRGLRTEVTETIEPLRREKIIGSSLEAEVTVPELLATPEDLAELFIVSSVKAGEALAVEKTDNHKCGRCWRYMPEVKSDGDLCARCEDVLNG
jgi:isoleucyl-tRNA synthetase